MEVMDVLKEWENQRTKLWQHYIDIYPIYIHGDPPDISEDELHARNEIRRHLNELLQLKAHLEVQIKGFDSLKAQLELKETENKKLSSKLRSQSKSHSSELANIRYACQQDLAAKEMEASSRLQDMRRRCSDAERGEQKAIERLSQVTTKAMQQDQERVHQLTKLSTSLLRSPKAKSEGNFTVYASMTVMSDEDDDLPTSPPSDYETFLPARPPLPQTSPSRSRIVTGPSNILSRSKLTSSTAPASLPWSSAIDEEETCLDKASPHDNPPSKVSEMFKRAGISGLMDDDDELAAILENNSLSPLLEMSPSSSDKESNDGQSIKSHSITLGIHDSNLLPDVSAKNKSVVDNDDQFAVSQLITPKRSVAPLAKGRVRTPTFLGSTEPLEIVLPAPQPISTKTTPTKNTQTSPVETRQFYENELAALKQILLGSPETLDGDSITSRSLQEDDTDRLVRLEQVHVAELKLFQRRLEDMIALLAGVESTDYKEKEIDSSPLSAVNQCMDKLEVSVRSRLADTLLDNCRKLQHNYEHQITKLQDESFEKKTKVSKLSKLFGRGVKKSSKGDIDKGVDQDQASVVRRCGELREALEAALEEHSRITSLAVYDAERRWEQDNTALQEALAKADKQAEIKWQGELEKLKTELQKTQHNAEIAKKLICDEKDEELLKLEKEIRRMKEVMERDGDESMKALKMEHHEMVRDLGVDHNKRMSDLIQQHQSTIQDMQLQHAEDLEDLRRELLETDKKKTENDLIERHEKEKKRLEADHKGDIEKMINKYKSKLEKLRTSHTADVTRERDSWNKEKQREIAAMKQSLEEKIESLTIERSDLMDQCKSLKLKLNSYGAGDSPSVQSAEKLTKEKAALQFWNDRLMSIAECLAAEFMNTQRTILDGLQDKLNLHVDHPELVKNLDRPLQVIQDLRETISSDSNPDKFDLKTINDSLTGFSNCVSLLLKSFSQSSHQQRVTSLAKKVQVEIATYTEEHIRSLKREHENVVERLGKEKGQLEEETADLIKRVQEAERERQEMMEKLRSSLVMEEVASPSAQGLYERNQCLEEAIRELELKSTEDGKQLESLQKEVDHWRSTVDRLRGPSREDESTRITPQSLYDTVDSDERARRSETSRQSGDQTSSVADDHRGLPSGASLTTPEVDESIVSSSSRHHVQFASPNSIKYQSLQLRIEELVADNDRLQRQLSDLSSHNSSSDQLLTTSQQEVKRLSDQLSFKNAEIDRIKKISEELVNHKAELQTQVSALTTQLATLKCDLDQRRAVSTTQDHSKDTQIEEMSLRCETLEEELSTLRNQLDNALLAGQGLDKMRRENDSLKLQLSRAAASGKLNFHQVSSNFTVPPPVQLDHFTDRLIEEKNEEIDELQTSVKRLETKLANVEDSSYLIDELRKEVSMKKDDLREKSSEVDRLRSELISARQETDRMRGEVEKMRDGGHRDEEERERKIGEERERKIGEVETLKSRITSLKTEMATRIEEQVRMEREHRLEVESLRSRLTSEENKRRLVEMETSEVQHEVTRLTTELEKARSLHEILTRDNDSKIRSLRDDLDRSRTRIGELEVRSVNLEGEVERERGARTLLEKEMMTKRQTNESGQLSPDVGASREGLESVWRETEELYKAQLNVLRAEMSSEKAKTLALTSQLSNQVNTQENLQQQLTQTKRIIEEKNQEIDRLHCDLTEHSTIKMQLTESQECLKAKSNLEAEHSQLRHEKCELDVRVKILEEMERNLHSQLTEKSEKIKSLEETERNLRNQLTMKSDEMRVLNETERNLRSQLSAKSDDMKILDETIKNLRAQLTVKSEEIAGLVTERKSFDDRGRRADDEMKRVSEEMESIRTSAANDRRDLEAMRASFRQNSDKLEEMEEDLDDVRQELADVTKDKEALQSRYSKLQEQIRVLEKDHQSATEEVNFLKSRLQSVTLSARSNRSQPPLTQRSQPLSTQRSQAPPTQRTCPGQDNTLTSGVGLDYESDSASLADLPDEGGVAEKWGSETRANRDDTSAEKNTSARFDVNQLPNTVQSLLTRIHEEGVQLLSLSDHPTEAINGRPFSSLLTTDIIQQELSRLEAKWIIEREALVQNNTALKDLLSKIDKCKLSIQGSPRKRRNVSEDEKEEEDWRWDLVSTVHRVLTSEHRYLLSRSCDHLNHDLLTHIDQQHREILREMRRSDRDSLLAEIQSLRSNLYTVKAKTSSLLTDSPNRPEDLAHQLSVARRSLSESQSRVLWLEKELALADNRSCQLSQKLALSDHQRNPSTDALTDITSATHREVITKLRTLSDLLTEERGQSNRLRRELEVCQGHLERANKRAAEETLRAREIAECAMRRDKDLCHQIEIERSRCLELHRNHELEKVRRLSLQKEIESKLEETKAISDRDRLLTSHLQKSVLEDRKAFSEQRFHLEKNLEVSRGRASEQLQEAELLAQQSAAQRRKTDILQRTVVQLKSDNASLRDLLSHYTGSYFPEDNKRQLLLAADRKRKSISPRDMTDLESTPASQIYEKLETLKEKIDSLSDQILSKDVDFGRNTNNSALCVDLPSISRQLSSIQSLLTPSLHTIISLSKDKEELRETLNSLEEEVANYRQSLHPIIGHQSRSQEKHVNSTPLQRSACRRFRVAVQAVIAAIRLSQLKRSCITPSDSMVVNKGPSTTASLSPFFIPCSPPIRDRSHYHTSPPAVSQELTLRLDRLQSRIESFPVSLVGSSQRKLPHNR